MKPPRRRRKNGIAASFAPKGKSGTPRRPTTSRESGIEDTPAEVAAVESPDDDGRSEGQLTLRDVIPERGRPSPRKSVRLSEPPPPAVSASAVRKVEAFGERYPFALDDFQLRAMESLADGSSVLVTAPTGTGKTVIAEYAAHLSLEGSGRVIYTTPLRALSAQKFRDFAAIWGVER